MLCGTGWCIGLMAAMGCWSIWEYRIGGCEAGKYGA